MIHQHPKSRFTSVRTWTDDALSPDNVVLYSWCRSAALNRFDKLREESGTDRVMTLRITENAAVGTWEEALVRPTGWMFCYGQIRTDIQVGDSESGTSWGASICSTHLRASSCDVSPSDRRQLPFFSFFLRGFQRSTVASFLFSIFIPFLISPKWKTATLRFDEPRSPERSRSFFCWDPGPLTPRGYNHLQLWLWVCLFTYIPSYCFKMFKSCSEK